MATTEQWICPYCGTVADYYVLPGIIETIDDELSDHRDWCKAATPAERQEWMERAKQDTALLSTHFELNTARPVWRTRPGV